MFPQITIRHNIGNTIEVPNQLDPRVFTYMSNNVSIGATAIPVDNAIEFDAGSIILLLSSMGAENAEFAYASGHTDQGFTVAATKMPHNRGDLVAQINYDEIVIEKSATLGGVYSTLATVKLSVTQQKTVIYDPAGLTTSYYRVKWRNSLTTGTSSTSEPVSVDSYPENSVGSIVYSTLQAMGVSENDPKITTEFLIEAMNDAREHVRQSLYGIRHAWRSKFEHRIKVLAGSNFVPLPDDIDFDETDRSVLSARFLLGNVLAPFNLKYIDKRSWNQLAFQVMGGIIEEDVSIGATTILLNSTGDFPVTTPYGVAYVATTEYDQEILQIQYTGANDATNQLTGVTGVDRDIPAGTQIWLTPTIAQPITYTVYEGKLVFDRIVPDSMQGNNLYIDYYMKFYKITDLNQELKEPYREIYKWYLRWAIKYRKDISIDQSDPDYVKFEKQTQALFNNLYTGQDTTIVTS